MCIYIYIYILIAGSINGWTRRECALDLELGVAGLAIDHTQRFTQRAAPLKTGVGATRPTEVPE